MNTTAWKVQSFMTAEDAAAFLTAMKNEWDALNAKVVFQGTLYVVIYPVPFSTLKTGTPA